MNQDLQPVTLEQLRPFPVDQKVQNLPQKFQEEFASSYELVKGYTRNLQSYQDFEAKTRETIKDTVAIINTIIEILDDYEKNSAIIAQQTEKADRLYKEFLNLETLQYQLLSSNYNQELLKTKYKRLLASSDEQSDILISEYKREGGDMTEFLLKFKDLRKQYHGRKEKLNRWDEDRVSGFI